MDGCIRLDLSHTEDSPSAAELAQWQVAVALSLSYTRVHRHPPNTHSHTPLSSSASLSFTLFYISVTSAFLPSNPCQLLFHALSQKCVQVNISRLLMLRGSGSGRYATGRETACAQGCRRQKTPSPPPSSTPRCIYHLNNGYV